MPLQTSNQAGRKPGSLLTPAQANSYQDAKSMRLAMKAGERVAPPLSGKSGVPIADSIHGVTDTDAGATSLAKPAPPMAMMERPLRQAKTPPGSPPALPAKPAPVAQQQTEGADPLTGDPANSVPTGAVQDVAAKKFPVAAYGPGAAAPGTSLANASATPALSPNSVIQNGDQPLAGATDSSQAWRGAEQPPSGPVDLGGGMSLKSIVSAAPPKFDAGRALGASTRGNSAPAGQDGGFPGGTGPMQKSFSNPMSASIYHGVTQKMFGAPTAGADDQDNQAPAGILKPARRGTGKKPAPQSDDQIAA